MSKTIQERAEEKYNGKAFSPFMRDVYIQGAEDQEKINSNAIFNYTTWLVKKGYFTGPLDPELLIQLYKKEQNG